MCTVVASTDVRRGTPIGCSTAGLRTRANRKRHRPGTRGRSDLFPQTLLILVYLVSICIPNTAGERDPIVVDSEGDGRGRGCGRRPSARDLQVALKVLSGLLHLLAVPERQKPLADRVSFALLTMNAGGVPIE